MLAEDQPEPLADVLPKRIAQQTCPGLPVALETVPHHVVLEHGVAVVGVVDLNKRRPLSPAGTCLHPEETGSGQQGGRTEAEQRRRGGRFKVGEVQGPLEDGERSEETRPAPGKAELAGGQRQGDLQRLVQGDEVLAEVADDDGEGDDDPEEEGDEEALVAEADAAARDEAVVVLAEDAHVAQRAVVAPQRCLPVAPHTEFPVDRPSLVVVDPHHNPVIDF